MLRPALEVGLDAGVLEPGLELRDRPLDVALAALAAGVEELGQLAEALGLEDLEGQVLELPLDLPDPEPLGQRGVDLHRLAGDPGLLLRRQGGEGPHVVEPVGELDEDDPDVLRHRQQHLPDVLGLLLLVAVGAELGQLGDAVDEARHLRPEPLLEVAQGVFSVLRDVVEERGLDRDRVDPEVGQDLGAGDRMGDVGLAGGPKLAVVRLDGEIERAADRADVDLRVVFLERGQQLRAKPSEIVLRLAGRAAGDQRAARRTPGRRRFLGLRAWRRHVAESLAAGPGRAGLPRSGQTEAPDGSFLPAPLTETEGVAETHRSGLGPRRAPSPRPMRGHAHQFRVSSPSSLKGK